MELHSPVRQFAGVIECDRTDFGAGTPVGDGFATLAAFAKQIERGRPRMITRKRGGVGGEPEGRRVFLGRVLIRLDSRGAGKAQAGGHRLQQLVLAETDDVLGAADLPAQAVDLLLQRLPLFAVVFQFLTDGGFTLAVTQVGDLADEAIRVALTDPARQHAGRPGVQHQRHAAGEWSQISAPVRLKRGPQDAAEIRSSGR